MNGDAAAACEKLAEWIREASHMVFFGGAGVSTESGIPDFRSEDGLYRMKYPHPPEVMLSHDFFMTHTREFYEFYRDKMIFPDVLPNVTHRLLARLESEGKLDAVVTQNIDGLHQAAGSRTVYELHGSVHRNRCMRCGKFYPLSYIMETDGIPTCTCGGLIKPDVVLYGEGLDEAVVNGAVAAIRRADLLIVGGTSLVVYPAAGFIDSYTGSRLVLINRSATPRDGMADLVIRGSLGETLRQAVPDFEG